MKKHENPCGCRERERERERETILISKRKITKIVKY